ncbi:MAG TPA: ABC transporter ATP-binding protein [Candidatus Thermoplasmatota archaeon]|nr:ABC transporter ATP-binding protein [Candidatus Thermoplasmatota archaeon]
MSLEVRALRYTYEGWPTTLRGVDLRVEPGELAFLLGPSGGGKTTVLRCIAGLERGYEGSVLLDGEPLDAKAPHERGVGMLFQEPALFPHLPVWRNVAFGMRYRGVPRREERSQALEWLRLVELAEKADAAVDALSGGQRQRVALARTLAARPRAVLLDEPLSALDQALREELGARIRDLLRREKVPALWVTHDESEARRLGDRVWRLAEGRVRPD